MSTCQIHNKYEWIKCRNVSLESDIDGFCLLHSGNEDKDKQLFNSIIYNKLFYKDYDFTGVFFPDAINFSGINFEESADFRGAVFSGPTNFIKVNFNGEARFDGSVSIDKADFNRAEFSGIANFSGATFKKEIYFVANVFQDIVYFYKAKFYDEGNLSLSAFYSNLYFSMVDVYGKIIFQANNLPDNKGQRNVFRSDFTFMNIIPGGSIIFQDISLAASEFFGTDMRYVELRNVEWYNSFGRKVVFDEILVNRKEISYTNRIISLIRNKPSGPIKEQYARIEVLYRYLKLNYEKEGDFKQAGDFHYGELEMHRRSSKWRWFPLYWYNLYKLSSGYGERPLRAFIWLLLLIPAWAGLVWGLGIDQTGSQAPLNYWDALLFIFEKATLQRPEWPESVTWLGKVLGSLSVLLLPGQAALFILALRNRLGRRR